ncbi:MAG: hypothetical protein ACI8WB_005985 [Phenylobacterium sp.]|jgi:hypothetical protein
MKTIELKVVEFDPKPYGRYPDDGEGCGQNYREKILAPALRQHDKVHVDLTGYNRYGRSFLDEAFGGLIRESHFSGDEVNNKLTYSHDLLQSLITVIDDRIDAAIRDCK